MTQRPSGGGYAVADRLVAGPHPDANGRVEGLDLTGVTLYLDLTELDECPPYAGALGTARHARITIGDFDVPGTGTMTEILDLVDQELEDGGTVYLHCRGGVGRTGTVVGCWLRRHALDGGDALARIATLRGDRRSPETPAQRALVTRWPAGGSD